MFKEKEVGEKSKCINQKNKNKKKQKQVQILAYAHALK